MTVKKVKDYFAEVRNDTQVRPASSKYKNGVKIPFDSGYRVPNPMFNLDQQMALLQADRRAAALDKTPVKQTPDMYQQAVALDGREPAAIPMEYTAPMNADQRVLDQLQALNGGTTPAIDPTVRAPDQVVNGTYPSVFTPPPAYDYQEATIPSFDPAFVDLTRPTTGPTTRPNYAPQPPAANVLRDSAGTPVISGNGNPIGLPNQSTGNAATGGKGGAGGK
jgi:hypothetical protein